jgi:hypothetical protein
LTHKEKFFLLTTDDRRRIGRLIAGISIVHVLQFLVHAPRTAIGTWGGIVGNALALYWCLAPSGAPNFWFGLLPYAWWIAALFDGFEAWRAISGSEISSLRFILSVANLAILPFLAGPLIRLHRITQGGGQTSDGERIA